MSTKHSLSLQILALLCLQGLSIQQLSASVEDVLRRDKQALESIAQQCAAHFQQQQDSIAELTATTPIPREILLRDGRRCSLQGIVDGVPQYYINNNAAAADTISTDEVLQGGRSLLSLDGSGVVLGLWDETNVFQGHNEFGSRVLNIDGAVASDHATHVAGTLIASGMRPEARGMAPAAKLRSFNFANDLTEMANVQLQQDPIAISTHSYGRLSGWIYDFRNDRRWVWFGDPAISESEDWKFGFYDEASRVWDSIAYNSPFYLIVKAAGNDREDYGPIFPQDYHWIWDKRQGRFVSSTRSRQRDGGLYGYDSLSSNANAKNALVIGAVNAVAGGYGTPFDAYSTDFSSWGPTDDGRLKPDVVAQGINVLSAFAGANSRYGTMSGTSMATPSVAGSMALVVEHREKSGMPRLSSASLRALAIHAADDLGDDAGPDYRQGWGLFNTATVVDIVTADAAARNTNNIMEFDLGENDTLTYNFQSDGYDPVKITLAWTDPAGSVTQTQLNPSQPALVNDLDVRVYDPSGDVYLPWILDPVNPGAAASNGDNFRDNVEQILIDVPLAGDYQIRVTHKGSLWNNSQSASLIITGSVDRDPSPSPPEFQLAPTLEAVVGFDYRYSANNNIIKLDGSQPIALELVESPDGMQLERGRLYWQPAEDQTGSHRVRLRASNDLGVVEQVFEIVVEENAFDFFSVESRAYGNQDRSGVVQVESGGLGLRLEGNRVRALPLDYTVTPATRLRFTFSSAQQGEVHAIGLDNDLGLSADRTLQLYGTQTYGIQDFRNYPGDGSEVVYDIPLGQYYTGAMRYLFFIMDHDVSNPDGQSVFSRVQVYEPITVEAPTFTSTPVTLVAEGETYRYLLSANGDGPVTFSLQQGPAGLVLNGDALEWTPAAADIGRHSITVRASNATGVDSQAFELQVDAAIPDVPPPADPEPSGTIALDVPTVAYGNQDRSGVVQVESGGLGLRLEGNRVRALPLDYTVTPATRLRFTFSSAQQGEVHAIGLDNDLGLSAERTLQLYGTQTYGIQDFRNYPGDGSEVVYDIPLGQYYIGAMRYLFFIMDHDVSNPDGQSVFSRVQVYEPITVEAPTFTSTPVTLVTEGETYRYLLSANGDGPVTFSLQQGPAGLVLNGDALEWTPAAADVGRHSITVRANNATGVDSQAFELQVDAAIPDVPPPADPEPSGTIALDVPTVAYGNQDRSGVVQVESGGLGLRLEGNRVRALPLDYTVTPATRLRFTFSSAQQGEVHAIGLDNDLGLSAERTLQLYGTQTYGIQDFRNYPGDGSEVVYDIPLGQYYTGAMRYLFFIMDHDVSNPDGQSVFSRVQVYEPITVEAPTFTSTPVTLVTEGETYRYLLSANGDGPVTFSLQQGPAGLVLNGDALEWTLAAADVGRHRITVRANNAAGSDTQSFELQVNAVITGGPPNNGGAPDLLALDAPTVPYGNQDRSGVVQVESGGLGLRLEGNRVRALPLDYTVTPATRLRFTFSSTQQGEVHAIGLDNDLGLSAERTLQLYGTQTYGIQDFRNYPGDGSEVVYDIPLGQYYIGAMRYLFFIMDHDVSNPDGQSVFKSVAIFEQQ